MSSSTFLSAGTCINNTSVMQFKKGSFEVGGTVYPVAIKYDAKFGDAFWNSSKHSMTTYLLMMMTSWAIVCDVWYLPPMQKQEVQGYFQLLRSNINFPQYCNQIRMKMLWSLQTE